MLFVLFFKKNKKYINCHLLLTVYIGKASVHPGPAHFLHNLETKRLVNKAAAAATTPHSWPSCDPLKAGRCALAVLSAKMGGKRATSSRHCHLIWTCLTERVEEEGLCFDRFQPCDDDGNWIVAAWLGGLANFDSRLSNPPLLTRTFSSSEWTDAAVL